MSTKGPSAQGFFVTLSMIEYHTAGGREDNDRNNRTLIMNGWAGGLVSDPPQLLTGLTQLAAMSIANR